MIRLENVSKISLQGVLKISWRRFEDDFRMYWRLLEDVLKTSWQGVLKISWRRLEDIFETSWRRLEDVLKTSWRRLEDAWLRQIYYSWPKRLEDVFLRQRRKTSSRRLHQDMLAGVLSIREKHCHFISQLQTHFMDFLRLLLLI